MATLQEVAKRAGVSPITVSRVVNQTGYFSGATRERVQQAVAELGYMPNTLARSLRSKRTNTLGLILTDITNPFFTTLARGVEDAASAAGFTVVFCNTDESETKELRYTQMLLEKRVDGILLVPARSSLASVELARKHKTPLVALDRAQPGAGVDVVRCDTEDGAYRLTKLLLGLRHRRIVALTGPRDNPTAQERAAGYRRAMAEVGLKEDAMLVFYGEFNQQSGFEMALQALSNSPRPTALLAANNFLTIGAMKALQHCGLKVPEDLALTGFDDLPPAMVTFPFFTVASQPAYEVGQRGLGLLLERLDGSAPQETREVILPIEIIIRLSSGGVLSTNN